jgi:hypothetical protein
MGNDKQTEPNTTHLVITREALAQLGDGRLAYIKTIRSEDVASLFPQAPKIAPVPTDVSAQNNPIPACISK